MFILIILLIFLGIFVYWFYKTFCKNKSDNFLQESIPNIKSETENTNLIISYGETIEKNLKNLEDIQQINYKVSEPIKIKQEQTKQKHKVKTVNNIDKKTLEFLDKCSKYIIGKYNLIEKIDISFVNNCVLNNFNIYSKNKNINYKEAWVFIISQTTKQLFDNIQDPSKKLLLGQTIIKNSNSNEEIIFIYSKIVEIASDKKIPTVIRMNAADILNMSNNNKYTALAKNLIRELGIDNQERKTNFQKRLDNVYNTASKIPSRLTNQTINNFPITQVANNNNTNNNNNTIITDYLDQAIIDQIPFAPIAKKPERTIYQDGQNVHVTKINETALETSKEIVDKFKPNNTINFEYQRIADFPDEKKQKIEGAIHRLTTDPSVFRNNSLYTIYQSLLNMINSHPQKDDLYNRLIDEMLDMYKMCATGHLTRLVNVIQGFDTKINNKIQVNISDELYAKIKFLIEKDLQDAPNSDELLDDILTPDKNLYIQFINDKVKTYTPKICDEYKSVTSHEEIKNILKSSLDRYTQTKDKIIID